MKNTTYYFHQTENYLAIRPDCNEIKKIGYIHNNGALVASDELVDLVKPAKLKWIAGNPYGGSREKQHYHFSNFEQAKDFVMQHLHMENCIS